MTDPSQQFEQPIPEQPYEILEVVFRRNTDGVTVKSVSLNGQTDTAAVALALVGPGINAVINSTGINSTVAQTLEAAVQTLLPRLADEVVVAKKGNIFTEIESLASRVTPEALATIAEEVLGRFRPEGQ